MPERCGPAAQTAAPRCAAPRSAQVPDHGRKHAVRRAAGRLPPGPRSDRSPLRGRVAIAPDLPERAAVDALLERLAEAQRPPVLAAECVADRALVQLALVLEQVLDERDLAVGPELELVLVVLRAGDVRRPAGDARAPALGGRRAHLLTSSGRTGAGGAIAFGVGRLRRGR